MALSPYELFAKARMIRMEKDLVKVERSYLKLSKEMDKKKLDKGLKKLGNDFSDFLEGSLTETSLKAIQVVEPDSNVQPDPTPEVKRDWLRRTFRWSAEAIAIIDDGLTKGLTVMAILALLLALFKRIIKNAKRLARTLLTKVINEAFRKMYALLGLEKVKWVNSLESNVCHFCKAYAHGGENGDGIYPIGQLPSAIPAHPNCRCILIPV